MTPVQIRMARAALELSVEQLASRAALEPDAVMAVERGSGRPDIAAKLRATLESAGVELIDEDGVRYRERTRAGASLTVEQLNSANDE